MNCFIKLRWKKTFPSSILKPLNELETTRLKKSRFTKHKIQGLKNKTLIDVVMQDLATMNDFLFYVEADPFVTPKKS